MQAGRASAPDAHWCFLISQAHVRYHRQARYSILCVCVCVRTRFRTEGIAYFSSRKISTSRVRISTPLGLPARNSSRMSLKVWNLAGGAPYIDPDDKTAYATPPGEPTSPHRRWQRNLHSLASLPSEPTPSSSNSKFQASIHLTQSKAFPSLPAGVMIEQPKRAHTVQMPFQPTETLPDFSSIPALCGAAEDITHHHNAPSRHRPCVCSCLQHSSAAAISTQHPHPSVIIATNARVSLQK